MHEKPVRRTQARVAERERRKEQAERKQRMIQTAPFALIGLAAIIGIGYFVFTLAYRPPRSPNAGVVGPRLQVDTEQVNLGKRVFDQPVRATFNLKNVGDDTLNFSVPQVVTALEGC